LVQAVPQNRFYLISPVGQLLSYIVGLPRPAESGLCEALFSLFPPRSGFSLASFNITPSAAHALPLRTQIIALNKTIPTPAQFFRTFSSKGILFSPIPGYSFSQNVTSNSRGPPLTSCPLPVGPSCLFWLFSFCRKHFHNVKLPLFPIIGTLPRTQSPFSWISTFSSQPPFYSLVLWKVHATMRQRSWPFLPLCLSPIVPSLFTFPPPVSPSARF